MASILRMPGISADSEEAVLLEWSVAQGTEIHPGDVLATVETEKANVDIESDQDAVLWRTLVEPGTTVAVGSPIAILVAVDEQVNDDSSIFSALGIFPTGGSQTDSVPEPDSDSLASNVQLEEPATSMTTGGARVFASPIARRIAKENNLSLADITGSGPGERIVRADVERMIARAAELAQSAPASATAQDTELPVEALRTPQRVESGGGASYTDIPHSNMRRAVAKFLSMSKREAPHFYVSATCRVDALLALRQTINTDGSVRVSINDFFVKAVAKSLADVPEMNVIWTDNAVRQFDSVDVSVAIGSSRGLVTPVIRSAETLTLMQISTQVRDFAERANEGRLKQHELEGGSFTVTNLGMFGVESFSAIINPPQVGILAVGAVVLSPVVVDGNIEVGSTVTVTVSADHRPVDGVLVATWLKRFKKLIENPILILT